MLVAPADERFFLYGVPWAHYEVYLALRGEKSVPRIAYLDGVMELMRPSKEHERIKGYIGGLILTYAAERGLSGTRATRGVPAACVSRTSMWRFSPPPSTGPPTRRPSAPSAQPSADP